jgi:hypothetical protein
MALHIAEGSVLENSVYNAIGHTAMISLDAYRDSKNHPTCPPTILAVRHYIA